MHALFIVELPIEESLPQMDSDTGYQLHYNDAGVTRGGFACVGQVPFSTTAIVWIEANAATIAQMKTDPAYLHLEDID